LDSYVGKSVDWREANEGAELSGDVVDGELTVARSLTGGDGMDSFGCAFRSCNGVNYGADEE
jgi:hypothetical protein